jgi:hypothetical protein
MAVNFEVLTGLLIRFVTLRIRNGDCTERQLARLIGASQPQLHNVLKGARPLKQGLADALLKHFQIGLLDLVRDCELCSRKPREAPPDGIDREEHMRLKVLEPTANARKPAAFEERHPGPTRRAS